MKLSIVSLAYLGHFALKSATVCAVTYEVTRLPAAGSAAYGINEQGQIAGVSIARPVCHSRIRGTTGPFHR